MSGSALRIRFARRFGGREESGLTLVELLVAMVVTVIVSGLMITIYFALSGSFSYSAKSSTAREQARQAVARMAREIRDAEAVSTNTECAILRARERWIALYTTFNESSNSNPNSTPHMVVYRLYSDEELWRFEDSNNDGSISGVNINPSTETSFPLTEQTSGEGRMLVTANVVNYHPTTASSPALFDYSYVDDSGQIQMSPYVYTTPNRSRILNVQIHLLVDLNPGHSPVYVDLQTSAQLRNQRLH